MARLLNADDLIIRIGAACLNDELSIKDALLVKGIIEQAPTVEWKPIRFYVNGLGDLKFIHVPDLMDYFDEEERNGKST